MSANKTMTMTIRKDPALPGGTVPPTWGICAVALPRESYYWLRDWIEHHINAGADRIVIYDNTGSTMSMRSTSGFHSGRLQKEQISKRGEPYGKLTAHLSDEQICRELREIASEYGGKVRIVTWKPKHPRLNKIVHGQMEAFCHFIRENRDDIDWGLFIDLDEYVYCRPGLSIDNLLRNVMSACPDVSLIQLKDWQFECRWSDEGPKDLNQLTKHQVRKRGFGKTLALMRDVSHVDNHLNWKTYGSKKMMYIHPEDCGFAHYNQKPESLLKGGEVIKPRRFLDTPIADEVTIRLLPLNKFNSLVRPMPVTKEVEQIDGDSPSI